MSIIRAADVEVFKAKVNAVTEISERMLNSSDVSVQISDLNKWLSNSLKNENASLMQFILKKSRFSILNETESKISSEDSAAEEVEWKASFNMMLLLLNAVYCLLLTA